ncbi:hypothetical protein [Flavobacterium sp. I3-2]|uniref:hypothetical protein n=1 Tax=Flavobacterium sp. I3-2 TaxID=2748319 RepID=UPI0015AD5DC2|nr:hypothetical protein [Flavobacterium sp. I3-2]
MKNIFGTLFLALFFNQFVISQNITDKISNDPLFIELMENSDNFYFSDVNTKEFELSKEFFKKVDSEEIDIKDDFDSNFESWLKNNLSKTSFKSVNEGVLLFNNLNKTIDLNDISRKKIVENYNLLVEKYGYDSFSDYYNKLLFKNIESKLFKLDLNCEQKLEFLEYNSWSDFKFELSLVKDNSKNELASKKLNNNLMNGAFVYENCMKVQ